MAAATEQLQSGRASQDAVSRAISREQQREFLRRRAAHITDRMWDAVVSRDRGLPNTQTHQSLAFYNEWGKVNEDPVTEEFTLDQKKKIAGEVYEVILDMSQQEMNVMALLAPKLASALVLDRRYITKVHDKDFRSIFSIALDWFINPDAIDQTQIRTGFGGEEQVGNRVPAYVISGIETLKRIKEVMWSHGNWAVHNALRDTIPAEMGPQVDWFIVWSIRNQFGNLTHPDGTAYADPDYLDEIMNPKRVKPEEMRGIVNHAWNNFTRRPQDLEKVRKNYHVTDKVPKLVIFNGANAAIAIDHMDKDKVHEARRKTQGLINAYINTFHPDFIDDIVFQNDTDWEHHNDITIFMMHYLHDLIATKNGERIRVAEKLHQFGQHHQRDRQSEVLGMLPSDAYAMLHRDFFDDPFLREGTDKLYPTNIMDGLLPTRNIIYRQGQPEIVFGAIRKLVGEEASMSEFIKWMKDREIALTDDYGAIARKVTETAIAIQKKISGRVDSSDRTYASFLQQAVGMLSKRKDEEGLSTHAASFFKGFFNSERFKSAGEMQPDLWIKFVDRLDMSMLPPVSDDPAVQRQYEIDQLQGFIEHMEWHVGVMEQYQERVNEAIQDGNTPEMMQLAETPEALLHMTAQRLETVTVVGDMPVYYVAKPDSVAWPHFTESSLARYEQEVEETQLKSKRLRGTMNTMGVWIKIPSDEFSEEIPLELRALSKPYVDQYAAKLKEIAERVDEQEKSGEDPLKILQNLQDNMMLLTVGENQNPSDDKGQLFSTFSAYYPHLDGKLPEFVVSQILRKAHEDASTTILTDAATEVAKAEAVIKDYYTILRDINPEIAGLEIEREKLIIAAQKAKGDEKNKITNGPLREVELKLRERRLLAEVQYNDLLKSVFNSSNGEIDLPDATTVFQADYYAVT